MNRVNSRQVICAMALCTAMTVGLRAQTFTTVLTFNGQDGKAPSGPLTQGTNGDLYGTTSQGGRTLYCSHDGCGTVFKFDLNGLLTKLHSFCADFPTCTDGEGPWGSLAQATNGNYYGTAGGGTGGGGIVFEMSPTGVLKTLHNFVGYPTDGNFLPAGLVQGTDSNFYGITEYGGANYCSGGDQGCGTIFKITPTGALTTLYNFCEQANCSDGEFPTAPLVQASDGNFYGTTGYGGAFNHGLCAYGCGTLFQVTPSGTLTTLYTFCSQANCTDGGLPGGLVEGSDGNLYGTTTWGGSNLSCLFVLGEPDYGCGTLFRIPLGSSSLTTLYSFCSQNNCVDGSKPEGTLIQATDGNFYGTTDRGGSNSSCTDGCGTAFSVTPAGVLTTLHTFCSQSNCADGEDPVAGLLQDTNGSFYGTTLIGGGESGDGIIYSISVGLTSFVKTLPVSGAVRSSVSILGTDLTGATSVTFNGTPATFKVVSASLITTRVPAGATTGTVQVVTPGGTLSSNVPFRVIP